MLHKNETKNSNMLDIMKALLCNHILVITQEQYLQEEINWPVNDKGALSNI